MTLSAILLCSTIPAFTSPAPPAPTIDSIRKLLLSGARDEAVRQARALVRALGQDGEEDSVSTAETLDRLVETLWSAKAEIPWTLSLARRASEMRFRLEGENPAYAASLQNYGNCLHRMSRYNEARAVYEKTLAIRQRLLDPADPAIAVTLNLVGSVAGAMGDLAMAREYYERALDVFGRSQGLARREARFTLFNLAELLEMIGDYAAVRDLYENLLREVGPRSDAPPLLAARAHAWVSEMDHRLGDDTAASERYKLARAVWDEVQAKPEILKRVPLEELANSATRLATAARAIGEVQSAQDLYLQGVKHRELLRGPDHVEVAWDLFQLAEMLYQNGQVREARPYIERAVDISTKEGSRPVALRLSCLSLQSAILRESGELTRARELIRSTIEQATALYGSEHPELGPLLDEQARISLVSGRPDEARAQALRAEMIARRHFIRTAGLLSHGEALRYQDARLSGLDLALSTLEAGHAEISPQAAEQVWDTVIRARGIVLDELIARRRIAATARDPGIDSLVKQLETDRERLAHVVVRGPDADPGDSFLENVRHLMRNQEATERRLAARSAVFRTHLGAQAFGWTNVRNSLPGGAALIAYVRYEQFHREGVTWKKTPSYIALVKPAGARTQAVPLGDAGTIDTLIARWRECVSTPPYAQLAPDGPTAATAADTAGEALRKAIWDPVQRLLGEERLVMVVPDGGIHQVNFAALPDGSGRFLVEAERAFHYLGSEKDLCDKVRAPQGRGLLAVGAPDFGRPVPSSGHMTVATRGGMKDVETQLPVFLPLEGARAEVEQIAGLWKKGTVEDDRSGATVLVGQNATEARFSRLAPGRDVIHLATHAFAFNGNRLGTPAGSLGISLESNPLLSSGLALAGANAHGAVGQPEKDDDGVLLGEEILSLDLSGVSWVVLSACNTGLGPIQAREGVHGLGRSFQAAGAATVITTLWEVEDSATRYWMTSLYGARERHLSTVESVRQASREFIALSRRNGRIPHPYYWGGFIATGDWR